MKRFYFPQRTISITKDFDSTKINNDLDKFENKIEDGYLVTKFDNREICRVEISKIYYNFDFTTFSKSILSEINKYFSPEKYGLKVASGVQEIRLIGDEIFIDNERYEKMISIINSTDKSRALSMNVGLIRTEKNMHPSSITILTSFSNKHYKSSLPDKIKAFSDNLINFNMDIDYHINTISDLKNKEISIVEFAKSVLFDKDGKVVKSMELKLRALGKRLMYNYGYRNEYSTLSNLNASEIDKVKDIPNLAANPAATDVILELYPYITHKTPRRIMNYIKNNILRSLFGSDEYILNLTLKNRNRLNIYFFYSR